MYNAFRPSDGSIIDELELTSDALSVMYTSGSCGVDQLRKYFCAKVNHCLVMFVPSNLKPTHKGNPGINRSMLQLERKINSVKKSSLSVMADNREMHPRLRSIKRSAESTFYHITLHNFLGCNPLVFFRETYGGLKKN